MVERKPLARIVANGTRQRMVHHPCRWPEAIWLRFMARAAEKGVSVSDVLRECAIAGLGYIETEEAMRAHRRTTL